ncbi:MAG: hypothetical protein ACI9T9_000347 [Oleiphilaceae bacterium]|jgi:hypothetical protein
MMITIDLGNIAYVDEAGKKLSIFGLMRFFRRILA